MNKSTGIILGAVLIALIVLGLVVSGAQKKKSVVELTDKQIEIAKNANQRRVQHIDRFAAQNNRGMWAETKLPPETAKKIKAKMEADFKKALEIWLSVSDNANDFNKGMTGNALKELTEQTKSELAQGKIKVRVHDKPEFEIAKIKEANGAVVYVYVDNGYYIDAKTKQKISKPINKKKEWLVGMLKEGKTWKISDIVPLRPKTGPQ